MKEQLAEPDSHPPSRAGIRWIPTLQVPGAAPTASPEAAAGEQRPPSAVLLRGARQSCHGERPPEPRVGLSPRLRIPPRIPPRGSPGADLSQLPQPWLAAPSMPPGRTMHHQIEPSVTTLTIFIFRLSCSLGF